MELIRKSDALHAVLHNTGDAAVAAVQGIKAVCVIPDEHGDIVDFDNVGVDYCDAPYIEPEDIIIKATRKEQTDAID